MTDNTIGVARIGVEIDAAPSEAGANKAKQAVRSIATEVENSSTKQVQATSRQERAMERAIMTYGKSREEIIRWRISQQMSAAQAEKFTAMLDKQVASVRTAGTSMGQLNNAMRMLPAQYTDIVTQIAGGQNIGLILLQQGGQIRDSFGSFGEAIKGVGASLSMFINPLTIAGGAIAALGLAAYQGADELTTLNAALISSGNSAGVTSQAMVDLSGTMDELEGVTRGKAVDALALVASTGAFTAEQMKMAAQAALEWNVATGAAVDDTVQQFTKLADDPVKAMIELNNQMGYLAEEQLEVVRNLVSQGQHTEAATEAIRLHAEMLRDRSGKMVENLGTLERSWRSVKNAIVEVWDVMKSVGRQNTTDESLRQIRDMMASMEKTKGLGVQNAAAMATWQKSYDALAAKAKALEEAQRAATQTTAQGSVESRRALEANNKFQEQLTSAKGQQLDIEGKILKMRQEAVKAGVTDAKAIAEMEKVLREQEARSQAKKKTGGGGDGGLGNSQLAAVRAEGQAEKAARDAATRELQASYAARTISANDYYAKMRQLNEQGTAAEEASIRKQIAVLQEQTGKRVQSGVVAQQIAALESQLSKAREEGASRLRILDTQEDAARAKRERALQSYRDALAASTEGLRAQMDTMVARVGMGEQEFEIQTKINDVYAEQARRLRDIAAAQAEGSLDASDAESQRSSLRDEVNTRVQVIRDGYASLSAAQADWGNGFSAAFQNYSNSAMDYAGQIQSALGNAFQGAEDAIVQFTRTGKLEFADLARSIMEDLTRIAVKKAIVGIVNMFTGGGGQYTGTASDLAGGDFGFADGGWTGPGSKYEPKGIVHADEVVFSKEDVQRHGGVAAVEAMRQGKRGFSSGGNLAGIGPSTSSGKPDVQINLIGLEKGPSRTEEREENGKFSMDMIWEEADARAAEGVANGTSMLAMALKGNNK